MVTNNLIAVKRRARREMPKSSKRSRPSVGKKKKHAAIRRKFSLTALSPPEHLSADLDGVWPPAIEPVSMATQFRLKAMRKRQQLIRIAALWSSSYIVIVVFAAVLLRIIE